MDNSRNILFAPLINKHHMNYRRPGNSDIKVSPLCLGMMSYGAPSWQPWVLDKSEAKTVVKLALNNGINFFDISDFYSYGASEEGLGDAVQGLCRREELVISTKGGMPVRHFSARSNRNICPKRSQRSTSP